MLDYIDKLLDVEECLIVGGGYEDASAQGLNVWNGYDKEEYAEISKLDSLAQYDEYQEDPFDVAVEKYEEEDYYIWLC